MNDIFEMLRRFTGAYDDADAELLQFCLDAAREWYAANDVSVNLAGNAQYDFWLCNLAAWMYDMRGAGDMTQIPPYILGSLHLLRGLRPAGGDAP